MLKRGLKRLLRRVAARVNATEYWESRYSDGGESGDGSVGRLAEFKARVLNELVKKSDAGSVIEFGCGDGQQLSLYRFPRYIGLDISSTAVKKCKDLYCRDSTKAFFIYDHNTFVAGDEAYVSDVSISIDVTYHIVDDTILDRYMRDLFSSARRSVVLYTTDFAYLEAAHIVHRPLMEQVEGHSRGFELRERIPCPFPGTGPQESSACFFVFHRA